VSEDVRRAWKTSSDTPDAQLQLIVTQPLEETVDGLGDRILESETTSAENGASTSGAAMRTDEPLRSSWSRAVVARRGCG